MHSENLNFRYASDFFYDSEIHYALQNSSPFDFDLNDLVLCNSHFALNVILLYWLFWYFTHFIRLYKPLHCIKSGGQSIFQLQCFCFSSSLASLLLSSFSFIFFHFLGNQTYLGDDKPRYAWLKPPFLEEEGHWWRFGGKFSCPLIYHTAFMSI